MLNGHRMGYTDASSNGPGAGLIQVRECMNYGCDEAPGNMTICLIAFASKSLLSMEWLYSKIMLEAFGILHGLKKFNHYCFTDKVYVMADYKPLVVLVK